MHQRWGRRQTAGFLDSSPKPAQRAEFRDANEFVRINSQSKQQQGACGAHIQARVCHCAQIGKTRGEGESELLRLRSASSMDDAGVGGPFAFSRADLIGKVARRTLLPGRAIPLQALDNPRLIRNGSIVKMVYVDGGLWIETDGAALQDGAIGDVIRLRNVDSGIAIEGRVQADGTVLVSGG